MYLWLKAFHIIAVICWMAGLFYLPRLFIYHAAASDQIGRDRFGVMEAKLMRIIMTPAMVVSVVLGLGLVITLWSAIGDQPWLWLKLVLVAGLITYHEYCRVLMRRLASDAPPPSQKFLRIFNEVPVLALIPIVILVVVKPFA